MTHSTKTTEERLDGLYGILNDPSRSDHDARVAARLRVRTIIATSSEDRSRPNYVVRLDDGNDFHVHAGDELDAVERAGACAGKDIAHLVHEIEGPLDNDEQADFPGDPTFARTPLERLGIWIATNLDLPADIDHRRVNRVIARLSGTSVAEALQTIHDQLDAGPS